MESRYYPGVEADVIKLTTELRDLFDEDFDVQTMQVSSTAVLQARKSSTLRDITGLSAAVTIKITPETGGTRVEIGMQKWFDKAAVAAVAFLVSGVLIALPAPGQRIALPAVRTSASASPARTVTRSRKIPMRAFATRVEKRSRLKRILR